MRGADCGTDHQMVRSRVVFVVRQTHKRTKAKPPSRLDSSKIAEKETKVKREKEIDRALRNFNNFEHMNAEVQLEL